MLPGKKETPEQGNNVSRELLLDIDNQSPITDATLNITEDEDDDSGDEEPVDNKQE